MNNIPVCMIEKNALFGEGLRSLLAGSNFEIVSSHSDIESFVDKNGNNGDIDLVIAGVEGAINHIPSAVGTLRGIFPRSKLIVMTSQSSPTCAASSFSAGADGYILKETSPLAILAALNMVMAGEKAFPAFMLTSLVKQENDGKGGVFSGRELQILTHLANGESNKQIALGMGIAEATVKVHVKTILRKLSLTNRTQAAIWAVSEGLVNREIQHNRAMAA